MSYAAGARAGGGDAAAAAGNASGTPALHCKIELPSADSGDDQFGGTRTINQAYDFSVEAQIGEGTYGQVFMGNDRKSGDKVALKKIRMDTEKEGFPITAIREIKILSSLNHENVVNLREIVRSDINKNNNFKGSIYMVFDYAEFDLTGLMESQHYKFTEAQVKCIMLQLLKGLAYCHLNGVLHRDLKASNILIDARGIVKLADFGLARPYKDGAEGKFTNRVITLWYRPPELLLGAEKYGPEIDMWSVGCIFAELLCGKPIFPGKDEPDQLDRIFSILGTPSEKDWPGISKLEGYRNIVKDKFRTNKLRTWCQRNFTDQGKLGDMSVAMDLLEKFLQLDPAKRISATQAMEDNWLWHHDPQAVDPQDLPISTGSQHEFTMKKRRNDDRARADQEKQAAAAMGQPDSKRRYTGPAGGQPQGGQGRGGYSQHGGPPSQQQQAGHQQYGRPAGGSYAQPPMQQAGRGAPSGRGPPLPGAGGGGGAGGMPRGGALPPGGGGRGYPQHVAGAMPPPSYVPSAGTGYGVAAAAPPGASVSGYGVAPGYPQAPHGYAAMPPPHTMTGAPMPSYPAVAMPSAGAGAGYAMRPPMPTGGYQQQAGQQAGRSSGAPGQQQGGWQQPPPQQQSQTRR